MEAQAVTRLSVEQATSNGGRIGDVRWRRQRYHSGRGRRCLFGQDQSADGIDTIKALGSASVTFANFSAHASSIEIWDGNGAGLVGTKASNVFDLRGLTGQTGLAFVWGGNGTTQFCR